MGSTTTTYIFLISYLRPFFKCIFDAVYLLAVVPTWYTLYESFIIIAAVSRIVVLIYTYGMMRTQRTGVQMHYSQPYDVVGLENFLKKKSNNNNNDKHIIVIYSFQGCTHEKKQRPNDVHYILRVPV